MKVKDVTYISDYTLHIVFADGVEGDVQLDDLVQKGIFTVLRDKSQFAKAYTTGYAVAWSEELEIDSDTIYKEITGKQPENIKQGPSYASN